ncbi:BlaI/MecI/CopY family transcriptional regulator [Metallumcola ferriviriculae]|uniref:BlaI/MecI/CopY family transcriptional regulator n=1 Tax=Metallumcola ferriviriculae TaxID=3039180 RepID=A0AAU0UNG1_9FIRM|nr:BlaI/MecI/CopY family transcriptional regulator [Desulfitibacteraceae bacterium MK1]
MKDIPKISEAEWEVLRVLWEKTPCTASEIIEALANDTKWKPTTVKTLLARLVKKNAVGYRNVDRTYSYFPLVTKTECIRVENKSFLQRVYGGALKPMLVQFIRDEKLTADDIKDLKQLLDERSE